MTTFQRRRFLRIAAISLLAALGLRAGALNSTLTWTGLGEDGIALNNLNWADNPAELTFTSSTDLVFGAPLIGAFDQTVYIPGSFGPVELNNLSFVASLDPTRPAYTFAGVDAPTIAVYGNVDVAAGGDVTFGNTLGLALTAGAHTINVADGATTVSVASSIGESGIASLVKTGDGKLSLSGTNTFSGGTSVSAGTLEIAATGALGSGTDVDVAAGATFSVSADQTIRALTGQGAVDIAGDHALTVNLPDSGTDPDHAYSSFGGNIGGDGSFMKAGPGSLTLTGDSTYAGGTAVSGGMLIVDGGSISHRGGDLSVASQGTASLTISNGGSVSVHDASLATNGQGSISVSGTGSELPSRLEIAGDLTVGDGTGSDYTFGSLSISDGGRVTTGGTSTFGFGEHGYGNAYVSGAGSVFATADLVVGATGQSSISVDSGGALNVTCDIWLGRDAGANGWITVQGAGTTLSATKFAAGVSGYGVLQLTDGAVATIGDGAGTLVLGQDSSGSGSLYIGDGNAGTAGVLNAAAVTTGDGAGLITFTTQSTAAAPDYFTRDGTASGAAITIGGNTSVWSYSGAHVLTGDNTYAGSTYAIGGTLIGTSDTAFGSGHVYIGDGATVELDSATPTIGGLSSLSYTVNPGLTDNTNPDAGALPVGSSLILSPNVEQLTISPALGDHDDTFTGVISGLDGAISTAMLVKAGDGELNLAGANLYSGGTDIQAGVLVASYSSSALDSNNTLTSGPLGTGAVTIRGGAALGLDYGTTLSNPVTLAGSCNNYAAIGGFGTLAPTDQVLLIGKDAAISPGAKLATHRSRDGGGDAPPVGTFSVGNTALPTSVTFASGGGYDWGVQDITAADGIGSDLIAITGTLTFNFDVSEAFTFRISSFDASGEQALLADFDASQAHEWVVLTATGGIANFDPTKIKFDAQGFLNAPNDFMFSLEQRAFGDSGSELVLTFNPAAVPEPSTWALLLTGLAFAGVLSLRRRRA